MVGHMLNTTILAIAVAGEVRPAQLILWFIYSYSIALFLLYRHLKNRGRSPRSFERATKKAVIYALFLALPWSSFAVLHLGALSHDAELILIALAIGMAASGTILLSAMPPAAFVYMSGILLPSALKCLALNQKGYLLLGALALSCWGFLAALIAKITRDISERKVAELALAERDAQLALAGKAARVGSFVIDIATGRVQNSPGYATIHGLAEGTEEFPRDEWRTRVHPDDLGRLDALRDQAFAEQRHEHNTEYRIVGPDGKVQWIKSRALASYDGDGRATRLVGVNIDVTERKKGELALAERDALIGLAEKVTRVGNYAVDINTGRVQLSAGCVEIHGFPEGTAEIRRDDWRAGVHPNDLARFDRLFSQAFAERRPEYKADYRIIRSGGEVRWIEARAVIAYDRKGRPERLVGINIDVTERKRAEEQQSLLIAELDHRVKNVLASVAVVARRTSEKAAVDFIEALDRRIKSMADAHDLLSRNRWQEVSLADLVRRELAPYATTGNTVVEGPHVGLPAAATQAMAMVLHELATNAAKYGALSTPQGRVSVHWHRSSNGGVPSRLRLEWREHGGPAVTAPARPGYGTSVIREYIPYELGGTVELEFRQEGVCCTVEITLESDGHSSLCAFALGTNDTLSVRRDVPFLRAADQEHS